MSAAEEILQPDVWRARQRAHEERVRIWTDAHQARTKRGEHHPVYHFLFEYYSFRPSWLRRWHPGVGVALAGVEAKEFLRWPEYRETAEGVSVDPQHLPEHRQQTVLWMRTLLTSMVTRPALFGCFGLHEWAMVYQQKHDDVRHSTWPLRLPPEEIARIVDAQPLSCTHYDAFRFFTPPARPLNRAQLARETVPDHEQRGCLHANMDLYKWAFKLAPFTPSELVGDAFALAYDIRTVDMRASPYNFQSIGLEPIMIETPAGRAIYETAQRDFARRGEPLRARLIEACDKILQRLEVKAKAATA